MGIAARFLKHEWKIPTPDLKTGVNQKILGRPCSAPVKHIDAVIFIDQGNDSRMIVRFTEVLIDIYMIISKGKAFINPDSMISQHSTFFHPELTVITLFWAWSKSSHSEI